jgi:uncharacterized coiled-coil protein SlyX
MSKIIDSIKHVIIEDDDPKAETQARPTAKTEAAAAPATAPPASAAPEPMNEETEHVYQRILAKTDFAKTQVAATIHKYLDPLSAIPSLDERMRFKTAVIQAKAQEGLTQEKILATFDGLKVALQNEQESFASAATSTRQQEIADRQKKVQDISDAIARKQKEIAQLQQQLADVAGELTTAQAKIQHAESQFAAALRRRVAEIDQEKAKYLSLLQG